jgi:hypothetical protein
MRTIALTAVLLCSALVCSCSFNARDADTYRNVTRQLLETKHADIKGCYDLELAKDANVAGTVVVKFTVQMKSGKIAEPKLDASSTAPASLGQCVVKAIDGLTLDPPDARDGNATFRWQFQRKG